MQDTAQSSTPYPMNGELFTQYGSVSSKHLAFTLINNLPYMCACALAYLCVSVYNTCVFAIIVYCVAKIVALIRLLMRLHKHNCFYQLLSIDDFCCCCRWRCFCFWYLLIFCCETNKIEPIDVCVKNQYFDNHCLGRAKAITILRRRKKLFNSIISFNAKTISSVEPLKSFKCILWFCFCFSSQIHYIEKYRWKFQ